MFDKLKENRRLKIKEKHNNPTEILQNAEVIKKNANLFEPLIELARDDQELVNELTRIQDEVKYLNPSVDPAAQKIDEKISNTLGDLKIILNKHGANDKALNLVKDIRVLIAERKQYA